VCVGGVEGVDGRRAAQARSSFAWLKHARCRRMGHITVQRFYEVCHSRPCSPTRAVPVFRDRVVQITDVLSLHCGCRAWVSHPPCVRQHVRLPRDWHCFETTVRNLGECRLCALVSKRTCGQCLSPTNVAKVSVNEQTRELDNLQQLLCLALASERTNEECFAPVIVVECDGKRTKNVCVTPNYISKGGQTRGCSRLANLSRLHWSSPSLCG
jgi:hypothetical protein